MYAKLLALLGSFWISLLVCAAMTGSGGRTPAVSAAACPDLLPQVTLSANPPQLNQLFTIQITITNQGEQATGRFRTHLYLDPSQQPPTTATIDTISFGVYKLEPREQMGYEYDHTFTITGAHTIYVWVDRDNQVTGACDFQFRLYDSESSSNQLGGVNSKTNVALINGFFTVTLDFGAVYNGAVRWLETQVRCPAGSGNYTLLAPRQAVRPTPYALYAERAQSVAGAEGDFVATGDLRSARQPGAGDVGGALVLENSTTKNAWTSAIRATESDRLSFDFWDESLKNWRFGARLDRDSNFFLQGTLFTNGLDANTIVSHGYLESKRTPSGVAPNNGGTLVLENSQSGNKWEIPVRADNADSLSFNFWNATQGAWWGAAVLGSTGTLAINQTNPASSTLLSLDHPKAGWRFHVDNAGHAEVGIYDAVRQENRWNVFDIDPATGHVGVGMSASPEYQLLVYDQATISTGYPGNKTMLQLHHPLAQWHFHFDNSGHPEMMVKDVANDRFTFNVLDIDPATGNVGIGGDASAGDRLRVNGNFTATGTKAATVDAGAYGQRQLYAVEAADVRFSDEGLAQLVAGVARVALDPIFLATIEGPYLVHVTPYSDASLYVAERGADYFIVKAREGDPAAEFAWRLSAQRKGYADVRLEQVGQP